MQETITRPAATAAITAAAAAAVTTDFASFHILIFVYLALCTKLRANKVGAHTDTMHYHYTFVRPSAQAFARPRRRRRRQRQLKWCSVMVVPSCHAPGDMMCQLGGVGDTRPECAIAFY